MNRDAKQIKIIDFGLARRYVCLDVSAWIEAGDARRVHLCKDMADVPQIPCLHLELT